MKARLRVRIRPSRHRVAQDVVDRVVSAYDERLDLIMEEVAEVLRHADPRRSSAQSLVLTLDDEDSSVSKAIAHTPYRPGSRGGKWYRDSQGNVRYGDAPQGKFTGNALQDSPIPHLDHLRPGAFMGGLGADQALTGFLVEHGSDHGFSEGDLRFIGAWYGTGEEGGELFDAFLECAQLTRDDLKGGVTNLRFGSQQLTYEEAVFEFFAAQGALFMGEDPTSSGQVEEWHRVLNEEIKPLLDAVFVKYEEVKSDPQLQDQFASDARRRRRRLFDAAQRGGTDYVADAVVGDWDPRRQVSVVLAGMRRLGLFARPGRTERHAYIHGRPHLRDAVVLDGRLLSDGPDNPLLDDMTKLAALSASQLIMLYAAAELHRRWDHHTKSFSTEAQVDVGTGELGEAALGALSSKTPGWTDASAMIRGRLAELVDRLVAELNHVNAREGTPVKHGPARRPR